MRHNRLVFTMLLLLVSFGLRAEPYKEQPGPWPVRTMLEEWRDEARDRVVPVKIYYPDGMTSPSAVIIVSHGLGGSREGLAYVGNHWASYGYVTVHLQHAGSDSGVLAGAGREAREGGREAALEQLRGATREPENFINRPLDVRFAVRQLDAMNTSTTATLHGRLDMKRFGMAGHSFGAWTTLAAAGLAMGPQGGATAQLAEPRIRAAVSMSAPAARPAQRETAYRGIKIPILHLTGTLDDSPIGETTAAERRVPFDRIMGGEQYLVIFEGGDHMVFSGRERRGTGGEKDAAFQDMIRQSTTAFWDAYLMGDAKARHWMLEGGLAGELGELGSYTIKPPVVE